jgi:hypothetical protein
MGPISKAAIKAIPVQVWRGPLACRRPRLLDFKTGGT